MVLVPSRGLGVVVLMNASNGVVPLALGNEIRLASGVARLLLGLPQPRRRLSFRGFYALLNTTLAALSGYQVWSLARLLRPGSARRGRSVLGLAALVEVGLAAAAVRLIPRRADSPWSLLRVYVPDLTAWLTAFFSISFVKCFVLLARRLL
jgi:hypothetical protein